MNITQRINIADHFIKEIITNNECLYYFNLLKVAPKNDEYFQI